jgi:hypothetical protein
MLAGFVGLISLIGRNWISHPKVRVVVWVFVGFYGLIFLVTSCVLIPCCSDADNDGFFVLSTIALFVFILLLFPFFCDFSLAAMTSNWVGMQRGTSLGIYWAYFVLERFTMFSS